MQRYSVYKQDLFDQLLTKNGIMVEQLFGIDNVVRDIKQNIQKFVEYCNKNRKFATRMIQLGLDTPMEEIQTNQLKQVVFAITEFLCSDEDGLCKLFFEQQTMKNTSQISQKIVEEQLGDILNDETQSIQSEVVHQKQVCQQKVEPYQLLKLSLNILRNPQRNLSCLGYLYKLLSFLIRNNPQQPLEFFSKNPQYSQLLEANVCYDSIANVLVQLVSVQDKNREYQYETYKSMIFTRFVQKLFNNIHDEIYFQGAMNFVEEVLNNTKQSYYQYFQDFKRCANLLVSQKVIRRFYNEVILNNEKSFQNAVSYLYMILQRANVDNEVNYYDNSEDTKQPTMAFEIDFLYVEIKQLIDLVSKMLNNKKNSGMGKSVYLMMIVELMKHKKFVECPLDIAYTIKNLLVVLKSQSSKGILKTSLYYIIYLIINKASNEEIQKFIQENQQQILSYYLPNANKPYSSTNNPNQNICFQYKIILLLKAKSSKINQLQPLTIEDLEKRFKTILGGAQESKKRQIKLTPELNILSKISSRKQSKESVEPLSNSTKKNPTIPTLVLPQNQQDSSLSLNADIQENIKFQYEEVQQIHINSPKRGNQIGFTGVSSPRSVERDLVGSGDIIEPLKEQQNMNKVDKLLNNKVDKLLNNKEKGSEVSEKKTEQNSKQNSTYCWKDQVSFYLRHSILI